MVEGLRLSIDPLTSDPYEVSLIRTHCHLDEMDDAAENAADEDLILSYMRAAIVWAEGEMHRTIFSRSHRWVLRAFPCDGLYSEIRLPRGKTQSVDSIVYTTSNATFTLTGASASPPHNDFQQDLAGDDGGVIMPAYGGSWPSSDLSVPAPVVINFTAGWSVATVPADLQRALLFYVSDAYEMRGTVDVDKGAYHDLRSSMISGYMLHRW